MNVSTYFDFSIDHWRARAESELIPYQAMAVLEMGSLLVLAPHPDDEVFGCGGTLALAVDQGSKVKVVVVSDGGAGGDAVLREAESRSAARVLGYSVDDESLEFWRMPDRGIRPDDSLVQRIRHSLRLQDDACVLAPSPFEVHPDHLAVCRAAIEAVSLEAADGGRPRLAFFEVGHAQVCNRLIDITSVLARKRAAMDCFTSQLAVQRYDEHVSALNRMRSYTLGPKVSHAESFLMVDLEVAAAGAGGVLNHLIRSFALRLGGARG